MLRDSAQLISVPATSHQVARQSRRLFMRLVKAADEPDKGGGKLTPTTC